MSDALSKDFLRANAKIYMYRRAVLDPCDPPGVVAYLLFSDGYGALSCPPADSESGKLLRRILEGETVLIDDNKIVMTIPERAFCCSGVEFRDRMKDDDALLDYLIFNNPHFVVMSENNALHLEVKAIPGTFELLESKRDRNNSLGSYRKIRVSFHTTVRAKSAVPDIVPQEISGIFRMSAEDVNQHTLRWFSAKKAVMRDRCKIYCGRDDRFITYNPTCQREMDVIFREEMSTMDLLSEHAMLDFAVIFDGFGQNGGLLARGMEKYRPRQNDKAYTFTKKFENQAKDGCAKFWMRPPKMRESFTTYSRDIHQGAAAFRQYMDRCRTGDAVETWEYVSGGFRCGVETEPQETSQKVCGEFVEYFLELPDYLDAIADIAELITEGASSLGWVKLNFISLMRDRVTAAPLDYLNAPIQPIRALAQFCISGSL